MGLIGFKPYHSRARLPPSPRRDIVDSLTLLAEMTIQFANPVFLLLALLAPLLMGGACSLASAPPSAFPSAVSCPRCRPGGRVRPVGAAPFLRTLAFVLLAVALAGPRTPDLRTRIETEGVALVMFVDVSGSMARRGFVWNGDSIARLDAVKRVFRLFRWQRRRGGRSSFRGPSHGPHRAGYIRETPGNHPSTDPERFHAAAMLDDEQPRQVPGESETNLSDALAVGLEKLAMARCGPT